MARPLHLPVRITMRLSTCLSYLVLFLPAIAGADSKPNALPKLAQAKAPTDGKTLAASEVASQLRPLDPEVFLCYQKSAADVKGAGHLEIKLSIHRTGAVDAIDVATPGLTRAQSKQISGCVKSLVETMSFPARHSGTTAVLPYFYQHTAAPNSGPQLSCWNPAGCKT